MAVVLCTLVACSAKSGATAPAVPSTVVVAATDSTSISTDPHAPPPAVADPPPAVARSSVPPAATTEPPPASTEPPAESTEPSPSPAPAATAAGDCSVVAVGDSVGQDVFNNGFGASLANVGCRLVNTTGARGITMEEGAAYLRQARGVSAAVAVVILGYHNSVSQTRDGGFAGRVDAVMQAAGDRLVVWSLPAKTPDCGAAFTQAMVVQRRVLEDATGKWPNLALVDYPSVIDAHPEYSQNRCPHLLDQGSRAVGSWLAGQIRQIADAKRA
jgi:hypothetical protein